MSPAFLVTGANCPVGYEVRIKVLNARCSAAPNSTYSANESYPPPDHHQPGNDLDQQK
jgi:hypothetical protein